MKKDTIIHNGKRYEVSIIRRPFREGIEVMVDYEGTKLSVAELGYGEEAVLEKLRLEMDKIAVKKENSSPS